MAQFSFFWGVVVVFRVNAPDFEHGQCMNILPNPSMSMSFSTMMSSKLSPTAACVTTFSPFIMNDSLTLKEDTQYQTLHPYLHIAVVTENHGKKIRTDWYDCHQLYIGENSTAGSYLDWFRGNRRAVPDRIPTNFCEYSVEQIFSSPITAFVLEHWHHVEFSVHVGHGLLHVNNLYKPEQFSMACVNANTTQFPLAIVALPVCHCHVQQGHQVI